VGRKKALPLLRGVVITDIGSEGNAIARVDEMVVFIPGMIPGDVVDVRVLKKKKRYMEGVAIALVAPSPDRVPVQCRHFGVCGGCRWQHLPYDKQLYYKAKQVKDNLTRISHAVIPEPEPILGSDNQYRYRNKLEYTFSDRRWMTHEEVASGENIGYEPALGFHVPGIFDKILDIKECHLQAEPSNKIRNRVREYTLERNLPYYSMRDHVGFLRNIIVRTASSGETMVIVIFAKEDVNERENLLDFIKNEFTEITSLYYIINSKHNDSLADQTPVHYFGKEFITENMHGLRFRVGPKSFYQTNSLQAVRLYSVALDFAGLTGKETVYDLYTGTGTIACFLASKASKVIGIEYIEEAVADARINARDNDINNVKFVSGDMKDVFNDAFISENGHPDVIITDPPRAGMHEDVVNALLRSGAKRIVYVSCNPSTQARDIGLLSVGYNVLKVQPVDMFPQTFHVENVALLEKL
jgi:23S rRNA (uracil1939-C5)-methyltransferase